MIKIEDVCQLDWVKILRKAIKARPTSWAEFPIIEWRNASDEVMWEVIKALQHAGLCTGTSIYFADPDYVHETETKRSQIINEKSMEVNIQTLKMLKALDHPIRRMIVEFILNQQNSEFTKKDE